MPGSLPAMGRSAGVVALAILLGVAFVAFATEDDAESMTETRSVRDGIYTESQAQRGKAVYLEHCVECHKEDLRGDQQMTPSLVGIAFAFRWKDKKLYDYFVGLRDTMPQAAPGTLGEETYADLVAYLLAANQYPAGEEELSADPAVLRGIVIEAEF